LDTITHEIISAPNHFLCQFYRMDREGNVLGYVRPPYDPKGTKTPGVVRTATKPSFMSKMVYSARYMRALGERRPWRAVSAALWILLGGFVMALGYATMAIVLMATIVLIPFGIQALRFAWFTFLPIGKEAYVPLASERGPGFYRRVSRNPSHPFTVVANGTNIDRSMADEISRVALDCRLGSGTWTRAVWRAANVDDCWHKQRIDAFPPSKVCAVAIWTASSCQGVGIVSESAWNGTHRTSTNGHGWILSECNNYQVAGDGGVQLAQSQAAQTPANFQAEHAFAAAAAAANLDVPSVGVMDRPTHPSPMTLPSEGVSTHITSAETAAMAPVQGSDLGDGYRLVRVLVEPAMSPPVSRAA
jgi:hypothetical protein